MGNNKKVVGHLIFNAETLMSQDEGSCPKNEKPICCLVLS
jgi:hypothetical protein